MRGNARHGTPELVLEAEVFALLERTADAAYSVTDAGEIRSWNAGAERLFGYRADEVLGRDINEVLDARDDLGTPALAGGSDAATRRWDPDGGGIANFDLEVRVRSGERLWINVSTIVFETRRSDRPLFVRLARDVSAHRRGELLAGRMLETARDVLSLAEHPGDRAPVDSLTAQERRILKLFAQGRNAASIARRLDISAQTLRNHLHRINRKLRTHSRLEAVTHAQRRGLLD
jgi:PAS domain S-box-containing protein